MNRTIFTLVTVACCAMMACSSCNDNGGQKKPPVADTVIARPVNVPSFTADSAYAYISKQLSFGARVPGSAAQKSCAAWMEAQLKQYCDTVYRQETHVTGGDGKSLPCINLIGVINPQATKRILLLTHWDSRPWADEDTKDKDKPVMAADDGGSGVGVLIELAQILKENKLSQGLGIDILLTDVEDYGKTQWGDNSYCLGTQFWAHNPHVPGYKAEFGILLDMVGARGAQFPMERSSTMYAGNVQQKIWQAANVAGFSAYFPYVEGAEITDDHVPINKIARIRTVDIINLTANPEQPFAAHWHTHNDVMSIIDKATLKAVGQTLLQVIYEEVPAETHAQ